ncbi:ATP-binding protein [Flavobacterium sp. ASW18X]|uniref:ATP-binding protein n=1 Tax=Flavobacterium sp. ASW18X TaxID=2572595 RepID=UPI0010AE977F|nr:ATP-binding protein [Flavobacterium sp. ASW18X]TKD63540.1 ATP-binding protein [Flavobacterium sp. ASW18X]
MTDATNYRDKSKERYVKILSNFTDKKVQIIVEDNGLGINLDKHKTKLFDMYKTFHKHPEARGIGLFMTKNRVEAIGVNIHVKSEVGLCSTFIAEFLFCYYIF